MKKKIYCFDFDGTLTTSDTLLEFIRYAKGTGRFLMVFLMYSPLLVLMKLHLFPNWKAKQLIFAHLFAGMRIEKFDALCRDFAEEYQHLLRPKGVTLVHEALVAGAQVFIVSASIDNWVRPFFKVRGLDGVRVLGLITNDVTQLTTFCVTSYPFGYLLAISIFLCTICHFIAIKLIVWLITVRQLQNLIGYRS